ncbi:hypothetical protein EC988_005297, partial [Linderina pennispora]
ATGKRSRPARDKPAAVQHDAKAPQRKRNKTASSDAEMDSDASEVEDSDLE